MLFWRFHSQNFVMVQGDKYLQSVISAEVGRGLLWSQIILKFSSYERCGSVLVIRQIGYVLTPRVRPSGICESQVVSSDELWKGVSCFFHSHMVLSFYNFEFKSRRIYWSRPGRGRPPRWYPRPWNGTRLNILILDIFGKKWYTV